MRVGYTILVQFCLMAPVLGPAPPAAALGPVPIVVDYGACLFGGLASTEPAEAPKVVEYCTRDTHHEAGIYFSQCGSGNPGRAPLGEPQVNLGDWAVMRPTSLPDPRTGGPPTSWQYEGRWVSVANCV